MSLNCLQNKSAQNILNEILCVVYENMEYESEGSGMRYEMIISFIGWLTEDMQLQQVETVVFGSAIYA